MKKLILVCTLSLLLACNFITQAVKPKAVNPPAEILITSPPSAISSDTISPSPIPTRKNAATIENIASGMTIQPADLVYMGAFRLPGDETPPLTFAYGGSGMTFNPDGNPNSGSGNLPGSLFISGIDRLPYGELPNGGQVAEIDIPKPVKSRDVNTLPQAVFLQNFQEVAKGFFNGLDELPRIGMQYLNIPETGAKIHIAWGQHFQEEPKPSHAWFNPNLAQASMQGSWYIGSQSLYSVNGYMLIIPKDWADQYTHGRVLGTGRFRDGGWSGMGPALYAYQPWQDSSGKPAPDRTHLEETVLLRYENSQNTSQIERSLKNYQHPDEWEGSAWLTDVSGKSAILFAGTKGVGEKFWYGWINPAGADQPCVEEALLNNFTLCRMANGEACPNGDFKECGGHTSERGWWSSRFEAQFILYDPAQLAQVAEGKLEAWQPQPYTAISIEDVLFHNQAGVEANMLGTGDQRRYRIGDVGYDRQNGRLYVMERFADGAKPVIHVWEVR